VTNFGLIKSFAIDDGQLDGQSAQNCFVLGYELAHVDHLLTTGRPIRQPVHVENRARIEASCRDANRTYTLNWMAGDVSESWLLLEVTDSHSG